jgi:CubicO group peptidase (beta-lactamase class C family)
MRLVERGRLDLDRTVRSYLPDFRTADAAASARVTVRRLLNHSAGRLRDFRAPCGKPSPVRRSHT